MKEGKRRWLVVNRSEQWREALLDDIVIEGDGIALRNAKGVAHGRAYLASMDGGQRDFDWGRLVIEANIPEHSVLLISCYASNSKELNDEEPDIDAYLRDKEVAPARKAATLDRVYGSAVQGFTDVLLNARGRYLWIKLELMATGGNLPGVSSLQTEISGDHMFDYLPAIYRRPDADSFLRGFLSIFNTMTGDLEEAIYHVAELFDFERCDDTMLRFLADWLSLEHADMETEALREEVATAAQKYKMLYTPKAICDQVFSWTGSHPVIIEYFQLRECMKRSENRELYLRLYGENPYKFFVLLGEDAFISKGEVDNFLEKLHRVIPAHVEAELILLKQNIHLDMHTYLGVNTIIGGYAPAAIDEMVAIQHDTIIGGKGL